jgi:nucleoid DNA-binding protein
MTNKTTKAEVAAMETAPTMTGASKDTLCRVTAGALATSIANAKTQVNAVLESIVTIILAQGDSDKPKLSISDFGTFSVKKVPAKAGRNPKTGEAITCSPTVRMTFKPSSTVKDKVIAAVWAGKSRAVAVPASKAQAPAKKGDALSLPKGGALSSSKG